MLVLEKNIAHRVYELTLVITRKVVIIVERRHLPKPNEKLLGFLKSVERKWQERWAQDRVFEADPDPQKPKYFITFPYPYINAYPHLGTAYTVLRVDIMARYKRMKGYNVLFPQGWHATGGPIMAAALRVREGDEKQIRTLKMMGIPDEEIPKFKDPEYWVKYFRKEFRKDFQRYGLSIDWRREFFTTYLNPPYSRFIQWQYLTLRDLGLITRGTHPVVWCPKEHKVVGDHDRPDEYAGISPEEVVIIKFKGEDGLIYPCTTYRPETVYGAINIWVNPESTYVIAEVDGERWVLGRYGAEELSDQKHRVKILEEVKGEKLVGRFAVNPVTGWRIPVLPASFVDPDMGTGVVMSVPAHAPYDYVAIEDLKRDPNMLDRYGIDPGLLEALQPVSLIRLEGYSDYPAIDVVKRMRIESQLEREKLERATKEVYTKEFHKGVLKPEIYGEEWGGKTVAEVKESLIEQLVKRGIALRYFTLPTPVYCRCGARTHVKIVENQWFLRYSDPHWKEKAHRCINRMRFLPEEIRENFHEIVDWYNDWACTHQRELGTPLPWDPEWVLESLSDSTIYMAYYTISKYLQHPEKYGISWEKLDRAFFDYVFLGKGDSSHVSETTGISEDVLEEMRREFQYWYPVDLRVSGKDLMQNHLVFFIFHHTAIFPEDKWPRGIGINGWIMVGGEKMAKHKGNFILLREALETWGADATRFAEAYAGNSGLDDGNFEPEMASRAVELLHDWYRFCVENYGRGDGEWKIIDDWFRSILHRTLKRVEQEYENLNTKNVIVEGFFNLQNAFKWYLKRRGGANRDLLKEFIEKQTLILAPITPHIAEEIWRKIGKKGYVSLARWPIYNEEFINEEVEKAEEIVRYVLEDIREIISVVKEDIRKIAIVLPARWKYSYLEKVKQKVERGEKIARALGSTIPEIDPKYRRNASKLIKIISKNPRVIQLLIDPELEERTIRDAKSFLEKSLGTQIVILTEDGAKNTEKAQYSLPARPAIIINP